MKILYLAFACNPYAGSEAQCGWAWPMAMREFAEVYVLTRSENKDAVSKFLKENNITDIKVFYHDIPSFLNIYYKTGKLYHLYYLMWQKTAYKTIKKLSKEYNFDYIHHVTLGDFRSVGKAWKLKTKFIFGPVGGAQVTPKVFENYVKNDIKTERKRVLINKIATAFPSYKKALAKSYLVLSANKETQDYLKKKVADKSKCILLTENGVQSFQLNGIPERDSNDTVTLLWSGRMVNKKGLALLLDILQGVDTTCPYRLMLVGDGPEMPALKEQAKRLGIFDRVIFRGKVPYNEMQNIYNESDIFVFPSLRETTGTVLFEAMAKGLPVITFNQNGADMLVDESCGRKVDINQSIDELKKEFAGYIKTLIENKDLRISLGRNAYERMESRYMWRNKCESFYKQYLDKDRSVSK